LLAWDAFRCHLTPRVNDILNRAKVDSVIIPGGCTKFIQAPDVSWNKPMKEYLREMYDNWLAESEHEMTAHGNMKGPSRQQMIAGVLEAWKKLPEVCYLDCKRFTRRRKRLILSSALLFQKKRWLKKTSHTLFWMRMKSLTFTLNLDHVVSNFSISLSVVLFRLSFYEIP